MVILYKQRCYVCKKNYVLVSRGQKYTVCYDCQKKELGGEITDPDMKKLFKLPEDFYIQDGFLRNIKIAYLRYHRLTEKQIAAFKKRVKLLKEQRKETKKQKEE